MGLRAIVKKLAARRWIWQIADSTLCLVVFFPSMVFYWRGIWDLFSVYIFPNEAPKCNWVTAGIGACSIVGYYAQPFLSHLLITFRPSKPVYVIVTRLYMYTFGVLAMAYWRGVWGVADYYLLQFGWKSALVGLVICHVILLTFRSSRTTVFPPFVVTLDTRKDLLVPSTCFQTKVDWRRPSSVVRYTLDSLLTHYVIMTATIVTWRSSLTLLDIFLFPDDWMLSNVSSVVIGAAGSVLLFALETPLSHLANHIHRRRRWPWLRLAYEDVVYLAVFGAESLLWRGAWNLNAKYIISDPLVGGWVNHAVGTVLLLSLQLLSYAGACGCAKDGQDVIAGDAIYSTKYLRHFFPGKLEHTVETTASVVEGSEQPRSSSSEAEICTVSQAPETSAERRSNGDVQKMNNGCLSNPSFVSDDEDVVITHI